MKSTHIIKTQQKDISLLKNQIQSVKIKFQKNQFKFIIAKTNVVKNLSNDQSEIITRLKEMRIYHKNHVKKLTQKMIKLKLNKKTLKKKYKVSSIKKKLSSMKLKISTMTNQCYENVETSHHFLKIDSNFFSIEK